MFNIGDKIVYPMHGAGVIEAIEEKEILGEKRNYYVLRMPIGDMKVMVPTTNVEAIGLRKIIGGEEVKKVFNILQQDNSPMSSNWNRRYRHNMEKIKSGNIYELAEVVRNLTARDREKGLSTGEKKMLDNARQILLSELVLAKDGEREEIESLLEKYLA
ncbi:MAG TPA: CarD family transcriptional regulator [Peptococcaceae bacterium]|jgi:CarD family transcriptional regulator|nr:CarD family transcriptional regulator [Clostridia bacterium]HOB82684.1 CarD family transcriptional regulator [Peptococcaceae bacterium]HPZ71298.1 CarD family transcriptional regulator [Peptococcaceae bacterium]HQD54771.1 CarD family transcriptional regulator [Peptococcaceae bacterium]